MIKHVFTSFVPKTLIIRSLVALCILPLSLQAATDVSGSSDDTSIDRFRGSWIVNYRQTPDDDYRLVLGGIETVNGAERPERSQRLSGQLTRITYQMPETSRTRELNRFFTDQLVGRGAEVLFACSGRACGSSTVWANQIFNESKLLGLVDSQYVITAQLPGQYAVIYIVERGNRRIYAHIDLIETDSAARIGADVLERKFAVVAVDQLPDVALIAQINQQLLQKGQQPTLVVHHQGSNLDDASRQSQRFAEELALGLAEQNEVVPVASVGAWVPSVLREFQSVIMLVIGD